MRSRNESEKIWDIPDRNRSRAIHFAYNGSLTSCGGATVDPEAPTKTCATWKPGEAGWNQEPEMEMLQYYVATPYHAEATDGSIWMMGGSDSPIPAGMSNVTEYLDLATGKWRLGPQLSFGIFGMGFVGIGQDKILLVGGQGDEVKKFAHTFDTNTGETKALTESEEVIFGLNCERVTLANWTSLALCMGGAKDVYSPNVTFENRTFVYNVDEDKWVGEVAEWAVPEVAFTLLNIDGDLYLSGKSAEGDDLEVWLFDEAADPVWQIVQGFEFSMRTNGIVAPWTLMDVTI